MVTFLSSNAALALFLLTVGFAAGMDSESEEVFSVPAHLDEISEQIQVSTWAKHNWTAGIDKWVAPKQMHEELLYFVGGYDHSKRPVVYWEPGRWDIRKYVTNHKTKDVFYKYMEQFWFRLHNLTSPFDDADEGIVLIVDMAGFQASQLSLETIKLHLWSLRIGEKYEDHVEDFIFINVNFVGQTWINIIRPIAGKLIGKSEMFGSQKDKWMSALASKMEQDQIPALYGGTAAEPVALWGR